MSRRGGRMHARGCNRSFRRIRRMLLTTRNLRGPEIGAHSLAGGRRSVRSRGSSRWAPDRPRSLTCSHATSRVDAVSHRRRHRSSFFTASCPSFASRCASSPRFNPAATVNHLHGGQFFCGQGGGRAGNSGLRGASLRMRAPFRRCGSRPRTGSRNMRRPDFCINGAKSTISCQKEKAELV